METHVDIGAFSLINANPLALLVSTIKNECQDFEKMIKRIFVESKTILRTFPSFDQIWEKAKLFNVSVCGNFISILSEDSYIYHVNITKPSLDRFFFPIGKSIKPLAICSESRLILLGGKQIKSISRCSPDFPFLYFYTNLEIYKFFESKPSKDNYKLRRKLPRQSMQSN